MLCVVVISVGISPKLTQALSGISIRWSSRCSILVLPFLYCSLPMVSRAGCVRARSYMCTASCRVICRPAHGGCADVALAVAFDRCGRCNRGADIAAVAIEDGKPQATAEDDVAGPFVYRRIAERLAHHAHCGDGMLPIAMLQQQREFIIAEPRQGIAVAHH